MTRFGRFRDSRLGRVGIRGSKKLVDPAVCCFNFIPGNSVIGRSIRKFERFKGSKSRGFN